MKIKERKKNHTQCWTCFCGRHNLADSKDYRDIDQSNSVNTNTHFTKEI